VLISAILTLAAALVGLVFSVVVFVIAAALAAGFSICF
jgi:hypothetical protein